MPDGRAPRWLLAALLPVLLLAFAPRPDRLGAESPSHAYLPIVFRQVDLGPPEPCAPPDAIEASCPGHVGWDLVCGGIGQVRDLVDLGADGTLLALGDGVARITPEGLWSAQIGQVMVGLEAGAESSVAGLPVAVAVGDQDQILIQERSCFAESPPDYFDESVRYQSVQLTRRPFKPDELYGWATGVEADPLLGRAWAAVAYKDDSSIHAWSEWRDGLRLPDLMRLPPMQSIRAIWRSDGFGGWDPEVWMVGADEEADRGVFVRGDRLYAPELETGAGRLPRQLLRHVSPSGLPRAYALGQALGESDDEPRTVAWRYDHAARNWSQAPITRTGRITDTPRRLGDALIGQLVTDSSGAAPTDYWMAFRPEPGLEDWIERVDWSRSVVTETYGRPPIGNAVDPEDPLALATRLIDDGGPDKRLDGLLYSLGDEAWRWDADSRIWTPSRQRKDLLGFVPDGPDGMALVESERGARLLRYRGGQLREDLRLAGQLEGLPAIRHIDGRPGEIWLAGDAGVSLRWTGGAEAPQQFRLPRPENPPERDPRDFVDVVGLERGEAWALTRQAGLPTPRSQIWQFDRYSERWRPVLEEPVAGQLRAIDAGREPEGSHAWAVGEGLALWVEPGCEGGVSRARRPAGAATASGDRSLEEPLLDLAPDCRCHRPEGGLPKRVCQIEAPGLSMADVDQFAAGEAWAVGHWDGVGERLMRLSAGQTARVRTPITTTLTLAPEQPGGIGLGSRFTALAAAGERDVWVVTRCGRGAWRWLDVPEDRRYTSIACGDDPPFYSAVLRFDGRGWTQTPYPGGPATLATEINVPLHDIDVVPTGEGNQHRVWLAGDWTTLLRRDYEP